MAHLDGLSPDAGVATCSAASLSAGTRYAARLGGDAPVTITTLPDRSGIWSTLNVGFGGRHCLWMALEYLSASHIPAMATTSEKKTKSCSLYGREVNALARKTDYPRRTLWEALI